MYDQEINYAWNELLEAITDNKHGLGSEQYTKLINLTDALANIGDDRAFELTNRMLSRDFAGE
jgi:hypothetical protein